MGCSAIAVKAVLTTCNMVARQPQKPKFEHPMNINAETQHATIAVTALSKPLSESGCFYP